MGIGYEVAVAESDTETRARFITRTYLHVTGALLAFTAIQIALYQSGVMETIARAVAQRFYIVLGAFILVGWLASATAARARSLPVQYGALAAYVAIEAVIFAPLIWICALRYPEVLWSAAAVTIAGSVALTCIVFLMRHDFSWMRGLLFWGGLCALGGIVVAMIFNFQLGAWFSVAMIAFAGASILYSTSNVMLHYPADRHVAAALSLFASVMLLFWYVLRLFLAARR